MSSDEGDYAAIQVVPVEETVDSSSNEVVDAVRTTVEGAVDGEVLVTGAGATVEDYFSAVYDKFPYVLALIALITFVLLMRTFRSILLPHQGRGAQPRLVGGGLRRGRLLLAGGPRFRR